MSGMKARFILLALCASPLLAAEPVTKDSMQLKTTRKIWEQGTHSAFTDLLWFHDRWLCVFREGSGHVPGTDGVIRVLSSADGEKWESVAVIAEAGVDLRDPKLSIDPQGRVMLYIGSSVYAEGPTDTERKFVSNRSRVAFSPDGKQWSAPQVVSIDDEWLWRVTWHKGVGYGVSRPIYQPKQPIALWKTADGVTYEKMQRLEVAEKLKPSETTIRFLSDDTMLALVRCNKGNARLGRSRPPYRDWSCVELPHEVGGPNMIVLPDDTVVCSFRDIKPGNKLSCIVGKIEGDKVTSVLTLPSGGDCAYPGLAYRDGKLFVSYYSSHESKFKGWHDSKAVIYWAEIALQ